MPPTKAHFTSKENCVEIEMNVSGLSEKNCFYNPLAMKNCRFELSRLSVEGMTATCHFTSWLDVMMLI